MSWCIKVAVPVCLLTSFVCYVKIFFILLLDHFPKRQQNQPVPLNIARYRKAVSAALGVQMTLVVCYLPFLITQALTPQRGMPLSVYLAKEFTGTLVLLNSSLNSSLYCWKIREVRQSVKDTMRELLLTCTTCFCNLSIKLQTSIKQNSKISCSTTLMSATDNSATLTPSSCCLLPVIINSVLSSLSLRLQLTLNGSCYREMAQVTNFAENKSLEKLNNEPLCTAELTGEVKHELIFLLTDLLTFFTGYVFSVVSLLTMTVISVDRLLALLLGLRYRQVATLKRTLMILIVAWILHILGILAYLWDPIVMSWCIKVAVPVCLLTSFVCYVKIFFILRHIQI
ncbi:unnamed protein product [Porites lobata]|uniref:G-protein coupled receptors family 1 profile domain-containing protein n=1 Tax=Porites lobata TaxID=104759 RepID=A0ABN8NYZ9_9CNID|nr:unnamed protein product [Porites lobata]